MVRLSFGLIFVCILAMAVSPVATITSSESFRISGTRMRVAGVPNWPLVNGDQVAMAKAPGEVAFGDGSRFYVLPNSKFKITLEGGRTVMRLTEGGLAYKFTRDARVKVAVLDNQAVPESSREGRLMAADGDAYWNPANLDFYQVTGSPAQLGEEYFFGQYRLTPFQLEFADQWRDYDPPWGGPPPVGDLVVVPPGPTTEPPEPQPVSNWRP